MTQATITPEVAKLFEGKNFASFATLMNDGSPHVAPTWVDLDGNTILINTAGGRVKEKNIRRDNRIALSIYDQENPYNMVSVRARPERGKPKPTRSIPNLPPKGPSAPKLS